MMYISTLLINTGDQNCDRPRPGRLWLRNIYHVHQRLSMAFPSRELIRKDEYFLKPYCPDDFDRPKFLFRIARGARGDATRTVILVQSDLEPNWSYAFQNAPGLVEYWQARPLNWSVRVGQRYRFQLLANPTKKQKVESRKNSRRVALIGEELQIAWLSREGQKNGFSVVEVQLERAGFKQGMKHDYRLHETAVEHPLKLAAVDFKGVLEITDIQRFTRALRSGIGSGKAFGFGLLSIVPLN